MVITFHRFFFCCYLTGANCFRKVCELILILIQQHQQHQRISSISASAASVHQQHQQDQGGRGGQWMMGDISFQKVYGLIGWQWSCDDLQSCTVDPDFWRPCTDEDVPRGPCEPKKRVFFLHLHQVLRGRLQYLLRCPVVNLWSAVQLVLQGVQD